MGAYSRPKSVVGSASQRRCAEVRRAVHRVLKMERRDQPKVVGRLKRWRRRRARRRRIGINHRPVPTLSCRDHFPNQLDLRGPKPSTSAAVTVDDLVEPGLVTDETEGVYVCVRRRRAENKARDLVES